MRRFIVEVVVDAVLLLFIVLLLGVISVGQPFPFGPTSQPIVQPCADTICCTIARPSPTPFGRIVT